MSKNQLAHSAVEYAGEPWALQSIWLAGGRWLETREVFSGRPK